MPRTKEFLFASALQEVAQVGKRMDHPARLQLLRVLQASAGGMTFEQLARRFPLGADAMAHHLHVLHDYGYVRRAAHPLTRETVYVLRMAHVRAEVGAMRAYLDELAGGRAEAA